MLDVLAGRRKGEGTLHGKVRYNGQDRSNKAVFEKYTQNAGYMLQLAEAFTPELTLRENMAFSALMRLPASMAMEDKVQRAERVIDEIGMRERADVNHSGP